MPGKTFTRDWFTKHIPNWMRWLRRFEHQPVHALEIGSYEGRSACWMLDNVLTHPESRLACIDPFQAADGRLARFLANTEEYGFRCRLERAPSSLVLRRSGHPLYSIVYVDGDHRTSMALEDLILVWPLLATGGVLIIDDCDGRGGRDRRPLTAANAFMDCYEGQFARLRGGETPGQIALEKVPKEEPA